MNPPCGRMKSKINRDSPRRSASRCLNESMVMSLGMLMPSHGVTGTQTMMQVTHTNSTSLEEGEDASTDSTVVVVYERPQHLRDRSTICPYLGACFLLFFFAGLWCFLWW